MFKNPDHKKRKGSSLCLRLTFEERAILEDNAGNQNISAYVRECLFEKPTPRRRKRRKIPEDGAKQLAKAVSAFAQTNVPNKQ